MKEEIKEYISQITIPSSVAIPKTVIDNLSEGLHKVNTLLEEQAKHKNPAISQLAEHVLKNSGKRIRSKFVLTSYLMFNDSLSESAIYVASGAELFHTATLLHDDVMDDANLRRGKETINSKCGSKTAVLLGDFFLSRTFHLLEKTNSMEIVSRFSQTAEQLGEGALTEQLYKDNFSISEDDYYYIIRRKTAEFFGLCASIGAFLTNAPEKDLNHLKDFGLNYGMAFQITDDLLDVISDETTMGKPRGKDILEGNLTLPLIKYFSDHQHALPKMKLSELSPNDDYFIRLLDGINSDSSIDYSYDKAAEFTDKALKYLEKLPSNDAIVVFENMVQDLLKRKK